MKRKGKLLVAFLSAVIGVVIVFACMYWFTVGHTERTKQQMIERAKVRLQAEHPDLQIMKSELYNGTEAYVVFRDGSERGIWFVPIEGKLDIERREIGEVDAEQMCDRSRQETGGALVSCKYGFDKRALIEVVTKSDQAYTYSYYTLQTGEFIRRVQLSDAM